MGLIRKHLAQVVGTTSAVSALSGIAGKIVVIQQIIICNTTGGAITARVFLDNNGTTYDATTAILYDKSIGANDYLYLNFGWGGDATGLYLTDSGGNLAVRASANTSLTFTINGAEIFSG